MFTHFFLERRNLWFKKVLGTALSLAVAALVVAGCPTEGSGGDPVADLKGSWISAYGEEYKISNTEFTSVWGGNTSYKGSIVNIRRDGSGAGYITIRYTEPSAPPATVGNFYGIRWENLVANKFIRIAGSSTGSGYGTIGGAESEYTGSIGSGSFAYSSDCYFTTVQSRPSDIVGSWTATGIGSYTITDKVVSYTGSSSSFFGEIVNIRNLSGGENCITFKYITNSTDSDLVGKYCVLYWTDLSAGTSVKIATAYSSTLGDEGKATQAEAEEEYTLAKNYYFSSSQTFTPSW
jgi:hypothetical protein